MRLVLKLKAIKEKEFPYNYNALVSREISNLLGFETPEFKSYLQSKGYRATDKPFGLFTFNLHFENVFHKRETLFLRSNNAHLSISFPLLNDYINNYIIDKLPEKEIMIQKGQLQTTFLISRVETVQEPVFRDDIIFVPKSPLMLPGKKMIKNVLRNVYYTYRDDIRVVSKLIKEDLCRKYESIYNSLPANDYIFFQWDRNYIYANEKTTKKLKPKFMLESNQKNFSVLGNMVPFRIKGNPDLIKVGYQCGFGKLNYLGFGFSEFQD
ncbi:MAG TPA: CRISPR-associated endoribonuclease Cas6 [Ignavibacteriales bacterium]|nr:CRISPR-associated endoribonuclease Cas6 [Ignavibacteriales bacterium]